MNILDCVQDQQDYFRLNKIQDQRAQVVLALGGILKGSAQVSWSNQEAEGMTGASRSSCS